MDGTFLLSFFRGSECSYGYGSEGRGVLGEGFRGGLLGFCSDADRGGFDVCVWGGAGGAMIDVCNGEAD